MKAPARATRLIVAGCFALAPIAAANALTATPAPGVALWCCSSPNRIGQVPVRPQLPDRRPLPATPAGHRLRRGRVTGRAPRGLRARLRTSRRAEGEALIGPARFVRADGDARTLALMIDGMHCGPCIQAIERALLAVSGVREARARLADGRAHVSWDAAEPVDPRTIVAAIEAAGYGARAYDPASTEAPLAARRRAWLLRLAVAGFGALATMFLAEPLYYAQASLSARDEAMQQGLRYLGMLVGTATAAYAAWPFVRAALGGLRRGRLGMDALATLAVAATWLASLHGFATHGPVWFDSLTMFLFLLVGARLAESAMRERVLGEVERRVGGAPDTARLVRDGVIQEVACELLRPGDVVALRPGDQVPADGVIVAGRSGLDEALLTGEARSLPRGVGDRVPGGAVVVEGAIRVRLTRVGADATQARLARLVADAERPTGRAQRLADAAGHWGTLAVLATAALTAAGWAWVDPTRALPAAVAVLVVTCPCALGLAIPVAYVRAVARALRAGALVKRGEALEDLASVRHVIFDKTGTLTTGRPEVVAILGDAAAVLAAAAALEAGSEHPLAAAIARHAGLPDLAPLPGFAATPGLGVTATLYGEPGLAGSEAFLAAAGLALPAALAADAAAHAAVGRTLVWVALGGRVLGAIALADTLRPEAAAVLARLRARGLTVSLLTGDHAGAAAPVARALGIQIVTAGALPAAKVAAVQAARQLYGPVAVVGDGLNDAPALAMADVGLALAHGADLATLAADVVVLGDRLEAVADLFDLAHETRRIVAGNLALSAAYNLVAVPLAIAGWVGPLAAAVLMPASSLVVLANTFRPRKA